MLSKFQVYNTVLLTVVINTYLNVKQVFPIKPVWSWTFLVGKFLILLIWVFFLYLAKKFFFFQEMMADITCSIPSCFTVEICQGRLTYWMPNRTGHKLKYLYMVLALLQQIIYFLNWSIADLQCCASLCCITKWLSYTHTYIFNIFLHYGFSQDI